jgi:hypothetical protein
VLHAATVEFATVRAKRKNPSKENAASSNIADRVTIWLWPDIFQASASHAITNGGWAFDGVEYGINDPDKRSRAAGM